MRLFVAVDLPADLKEQLASLCQGIPGARWVPAENMHLTLRFIGEVDGHAFEDIVEALGAVQAQPLELKLKGVGHFASGRQPRALWVGVDRSESLQRLHERVEMAVQRAGLAPEGRKYRPHVTLARLKEAATGRLESFLTQHSLFQSRPFPVTGFTLFSSFLSRNGAIYRAEAEFPFDRPEPEQEEDEGWSSYDPWKAAAAED